MPLLRFGKFVNIISVSKFSTLFSLSSPLGIQIVQTFGQLIISCIFHGFSSFLKITILFSLFFFLIGLFQNSYPWSQKVFPPHDIFTFKIVSDMFHFTDL